MRGLLRDRALLDRWAGEATAQVQSAVEQVVATRVLAAESSLTAAQGEQDEVESTRVAEQVSVIDTELREHSVVGARAAALRGKEMPTLQAALEAVRDELGEPEPPAEDEESDVRLCGRRVRDLGVRPRRRTGKRARNHRQIPQITCSESFL